jgi:hypothetical protein
MFLRYSIDEVGIQDTVQLQIYSPTMYGSSLRPMVYNISTGGISGRADQQDNLASMAPGMGLCPLARPTGKKVMGSEKSRVDCGPYFAR